MATALVLGGVSWNKVVYVNQLPEPIPQTTFSQGAHETVGATGAGEALDLHKLG